MNTFRKKLDSEIPMNVVMRVNGRVDPGGSSIEERALKSIRIWLTDNQRNLYRMIISPVSNIVVWWKEPQFRGKGTNFTGKAHTVDGGVGPTPYSRRCAWFCLLSTGTDYF